MPPYKYQLLIQWNKKHVRIKNATTKHIPLQELRKVISKAKKGKVIWA